MKVQSINMENFMIFKSLSMDFSPQINVIFGENSVGKSALIKLLYSSVKGWTDIIKKGDNMIYDKAESILLDKIVGVFMPDDGALAELSKMGVQIFVTTHSYFVQQSFELLARYGKCRPDVQFISLYKDEEDKQIKYEKASSILEIEHNSIMEEFDAIYAREQELME